MQDGDGSAKVDAMPAVRLSVSATREKGTGKQVAVSGIASRTGALADLFWVDLTTVW